VAKVEWHPGELYPRVGFIVSNLARSPEGIVAFYNQTRQPLEARIAPSGVLSNGKSRVACPAGRHSHLLAGPLRQNTLLYLRQGAPHPFLRGAPSACEQWIKGRQERDQVDAAVVPHLSVALSDLDVRHAGAGGARRPATSDRMSANICRGTATSAIWNVT
jgi:hypothetical protein